MFDLAVVPVGTVALTTSTLTTLHALLRLPFVASQKSFAVTSGFASILTGVIVIPCASTGMVLGGYLVKRFKMEDVAIARMCTAFSAAATATVVFLLLRCDTPGIFGVNKG
jgi:organic anion transporter 5A